MTQFDAPRFKIDEKTLNMWLIDENMGGARVQASHQGRALDRRSTFKMADLVSGQVQVRLQNGGPGVQVRSRSAFKRVDLNPGSRSRT